MGVISQLSNFIALLNYFVPLGIPNGLSKLVAEENITEKEKLKNIFISSATIVFYPTFFFSLIFFLFSGTVSGFLFDTSDYSLHIKIISLFIPFLVLNSLLEGYLRGLKVINVYVKVIIVTNLFNLIVLIPLVWFLGLMGGLYGLISAFVIYVFVCVYQLKKNNLIDKPEFRKTFDRTILKKIIRVSFVFLISGALFQLSLLLLRKIIISELGIYYNGIFQSVIGISMNYFGFIFLSLSTYSFPTISKMFNDSDISAELNVNIKYIIFLMVPLIILLFVFRSTIISVLFTKDFLVSEDLYAYQFLGDYFKALAWATGIWLVPKMKLKPFLILEIILNINLVFITYLFINYFGAHLELISLSYLVSYIIHFLLNYFITARLIDFRINRENLRLLVLSLLFMISIILISNYNKMYGYIIVIPLLFFWISISMKKEELLEIKKLVYSKLRK